MHDEIIIFTDGGARGNPGPAASGVVIKTTDGKVLEAFGRYLGETTNNQAEYKAILFALQEAEKYQPKRIQFFLDSELATKQLNGEYRVKNEDLKPIYLAIKELASHYDITFEHVYRKDNKAADAQVNLAIDKALGLK
ncbi:MAG TPA: ribonuclease HI family protein [Candidatus Saccharimonadales bacterium]|nr:ribonuclease HI family protein [Candidatus Saccharimonadales bacterium]